MTMTLKEIYQALADGKTLTHIYGKIVRIKDNCLVTDKGFRTRVCFDNPEDWEIYKGPKEDPRNWIGKLCWFWDDKNEEKILQVLLQFSKHAFLGGMGTYWYINCRPATKEEVEQYLVKEN